MPAYTDNLDEDITYWPLGAPDGYGKAALGAPVPLKARWQDKAVMARDAQGREFVTEAVVYVSAEVALGGYLYRGTSVAAAPPAEAREVRSRGSSPALDSSRTLYKALL